MAALYDRVLHNTVFRWAETFVAELRAAGENRSEIAPRRLVISELLPAYQTASQRLLLLDYDGTLVPFAGRPELARPSTCLIEILDHLASDAANTVAVVSGRIAAQLTAWFGNIRGLTLAAEHGAKIREPASTEWRELRESPGVAAWKDKVRPILQHFADRTPGSLVEEKDYALAWHYRRVDPEFGEWQAGELTALLGGMLADTDARPVRGHKVIEVRPTWANKGDLADWMLGLRPDFGFIFAAGDDRTDEDMFARLPEGSWTVHVGNGNSRAVWQVDTPQAMLDLLNGLKS